jgi:hypothetical protein
MAACKGEINSDTLYTYDRARKWYPLFRLIGDPSKLNIQIIEDTWPRYYIRRDDPLHRGNEIAGPYSYYDLQFMIKDKRVNHLTLYKTENFSEWKPLSKLPLPRIPMFVEKNPPPETRWLESSRRQWTTDGITISAVIGFGPGRTKAGYWILKEHSKLSSNPGNLFMTFAPTIDFLRELLADGSIRPETPCAKENASEWLTVKDFL